MIRFDITHCTTYDYHQPVQHGHHLAVLRPRGLPTQRVIFSAVTVEPAPAAARRLMDDFGNHLDLFEVRGGHRELRVTARSVVEVASRPLPSSCGAWEDVVARVKRERRSLPANEFAFASPLLGTLPQSRAYAEKSFPVGRDAVEAVFDLNRRVFTEFRYEPASTDVTTPLHQVLELRRGVCQDFAHVMVACLRSMGFPSRYVSGYLETQPPTGQPRLVGVDASHAWASVYLPDFGWWDLDPTNGTTPDSQHVTVAWGRDFSDVSPLRGVVLGGGSHRVGVGVDVVRQPVTG